MVDINLWHQLLRDRIEQQRQHNEQLRNQARNQLQSGLGGIGGIGHNYIAPPGISEGATPYSGGRYSTGSCKSFGCADCHQDFVPDDLIVVGADRTLYHINCLVKDED